MPESRDKPNSTDDLVQEFKKLTVPHRRESNQTRKPSEDSGLPPIPRFFLDAILDTIATSIEKALADVMTRCVGQVVEQRLRPLTGEIALLRTAIEYDLTDNGQRRRRASSRSEDTREK